MKKMLAKRNNQGGLTLIEILVALVLSLFLLIGLIQIFIGTRQSSRVLENLSRVQENGRFSIDAINRIVRLAGYRSRENVEGDQSIEKVFNSLPIIQGVDGDNDEVTVAFQGETLGQGELRDCLNNLITAPTTTTNRFSIVGTTLNCQSTINTTPPTVVELPIVDNVEGMQILYGEDNSSQFSSPNRYLTVDDVGNLNNVRSVRISLLLRTQENNLVDDPQPYTFNGTTVTPPSDDRRLRRVFTTTVMLRNKL